MRTKGQLYVFYLDIVYASGSATTTIKRTSTNRRLAILSAMKHIEATDVSSVKCHVGIPRTEHERKKKHNLSRAMKASHARKRESELMTYDGTTLIE